MSAPAHCPHCFGDHDGCTQDKPRCSAAVADRLPAKLSAFALHVLDEMEGCNGEADACIRLQTNLYWAALRAGLTSQQSGQAVVKDHVKLYGDRIRKGEAAKHHRYE